MSKAKDTLTIAYDVNNKITFLPISKKKLHWREQNALVVRTQEDPYIKALAVYASYPKYCEENKIKPTNEIFFRYKENDDFTLTEVTSTFIKKYANGHLRYYELFCDFCWNSNLAKKIIICLCPTCRDEMVIMCESCAPGMIDNKNSTVDGPYCDYLFNHIKEGATCSEIGRLIGR